MQPHFSTSHLLAEQMVDVLRTKSTPLPTSPWLVLEATIRNAAVIRPSKVKPGHLCPGVAVTNHHMSVPLITRTFHDYRPIRSIPHGHFGSSKWLDILVDTEQIVRIIFHFQFHESIIVAAISQLDTPLLFLGQEVHVRATRCKRCCRLE